MNLATDTPAVERRSALLRWSILGMLVMLAVPACFPAPTTRMTAFVVAAFDDDCEDLLVREIQKANREILVAVYLISRPRVVNALVNAAGRGVKIHLKYDAGESSFKRMRSALRKLRSKGVMCSGIRLRGGALMHHKFVVIDGLRVLTGSFNFTYTAARKNYENLVLIESPMLARVFTEEFESIVSR